MGACDSQGWHTHKVDHSTSDLRRYFGSSCPSHRGGLVGQALRLGAYSLGGTMSPSNVLLRAVLCSTGEGSLPRLSSAGKHHHHMHIHLHPSTTTTLHHLSQIPICSAHRNCGWPSITKTPSV